jgi:hypothetical protein
MAINYRNIQNPQSEQLGYLKLLNDLISTSQKEKDAQRKFEQTQDANARRELRADQSDYFNAYANYNTAMNLGKYDEAEGFLNIMYTFEDTPVKFAKPMEELNEDFLSRKSDGANQRLNLNFFKSRNRQEIEIGGKYLMDNMDKLQPHILKEYNQFVASPVYNNSPVYEFARANFPLDVNLYNQTVGPYSSIEEFEFRKPEEFKKYLEAMQLTTPIPEGTKPQDAINLVKKEVATKILPRLQEEKFDTFLASGGNIQSAFESGNYRTKENIVKSVKGQVASEFLSKNPNFANIDEEQQENLIESEMSKRFGKVYDEYTGMKKQQEVQGLNLQDLSKQRNELQLKKEQLKKPLRQGLQVVKPDRFYRQYGGRVEGRMGREVFDVPGQQLLDERDKELSDVEAQLRQLDNNIQLLRDQNAQGL